MVYQYLKYFFQSPQCWKGISCNIVPYFGHKIQEEYGPVGENPRNSHEKNKILEKFFYENIEPLYRFNHKKFEKRLILVSTI